MTLERVSPGSLVAETLGIAAGVVSHTSLTGNGMRLGRGDR